jgi:hypothetical protein
MTDTTAPLDDPTYQPTHVPVPGVGVPDVVELWGVASQIRWFRRFSAEIYAMRLPGLLGADRWERWYTESTQHKGWCCRPCTGEDESEWPEPPACCCHSEVYGDMPPLIIPNWKVET